MSEQFKPVKIGEVSADGKFTMVSRDDLFALPEGVREAVERMIVLCAAADKTGKWVRADCDVVIIAELLRLSGSLTARQTIDAISRAERAEAELAALKAEMDQLRADAETGKAWRTDNSLEEWFPLTAAELKYVKTELAAIKARIADAPVASVRVDDRMHVSIGARSNAVDFVPLHTKRVRLLVEE